MKKMLIVLTLVSAGLLFPGKSTGQNLVSLGVKVGYNASKLSTDLDLVKSSFKSGFQFGAYVRIGKKLYVQPELYYTTQGGVFTSNTQNWKQNVKIGSLDVPVLIGYKLINTDLLNLRILAGPVASFVVNKSIADDGTSLGPITGGDLKSVNWAIDVGAGMDIWRFTFDLRYQIGLNDLVKEVTDVQNNDWSFDSKNNVWVVSLGFRIF